MKIEAIITHRNELPQNLHKTYYGLRAHGIDVRLMHDTEGLGCGYVRDKGITESRADVVFLCDAHMRFSPGYFRAVAEHLERNPYDITVSRMQSMGHDWTDKAGELYAGAEVMLCDEIPGNQFIPIAAKWRRDDTGDGPIGAAMGACYGMRRERYMEMGRPLAFLRAWGCDEEMLSIACHMTGGKVALIPGTAHHMYAAPKVGAKPLSQDETVRIWANRVAMLSAIPMQETTRDKLVEWVRRTDYVQRNKRAINESLLSRCKDIERVQRILQESSMTFEVYMEEWGRSHTAKNEAEIVREQQRFEADAQRPTPAETTPYRCAANYGANENNRICGCGSPDSSIDTVRKTGRLIIRYRVCASCGHRRTTQEIVPML